MSPTQRSLEHFKKLGWTAAITERWNAHAKLRQDLFGFADLLVLSGNAQGIYAVQVTSGSNVSARIKKIQEEPKAKLFLESGGKILVHGWRKVKVKRGGKAMRWEMRYEEITLNHFNPSPIL